LPAESKTTRRALCVLDVIESNSPTNHAEQHKEACMRKHIDPSVGPTGPSVDRRALLRGVALAGAAATGAVAPLVRAKADIWEESRRRYSSSG